MESLLKSSKIKIALFLVVSAGVAFASLAMVARPEWPARDAITAFLSLLTFITGIAFLLEGGGAENRKIDPFGDDALGSGTFAAEFLKSLDPTREEELLQYLRNHQPEAVESIRTHRVIFSDLPRHSPAAVRAALSDCSSEDRARALSGLDGDFLEFIREMTETPAESPENPIANGPPPADSRRKIVDGVEAFYTRVGIHDFGIPLRN